MYANKLTTTKINIFPFSAFLLVRNTLMFSLFLVCYSRRNFPFFLFFLRKRELRKILTHFFIILFFLNFSFSCCLCWARQVNRVDFDVMARAIMELEKEKLLARGDGNFGGAVLMPKYEKAKRRFFCYSTFTRNFLICCRLNFWQISRWWSNAIINQLTWESLQSSDTWRRRLSRIPLDVIRYSLNLTIFFRYIKFLKFLRHFLFISENLRKSSLMRVNFANDNFTNTFSTCPTFLIFLLMKN